MDEKQRSKQPNWLVWAAVVSVVNTIIWIPGTLDQLERWPEMFGWVNVEVFRGIAFIAALSSGGVVGVHVAGRCRKALQAWKRRRAFAKAGDKTPAGSPTEALKAHEGEHPAPLSGAFSLGPRIGGVWSNSFGEGVYRFDFTCKRTGDATVRVRGKPATIQGVAVRPGTMAIHRATDAYSWDYGESMRDVHLGNVVVLRNHAGYYLALHYFENKESKAFFRFQVRRSGDFSMTATEIAARKEKWGH